MPKLKMFEINNLEREEIIAKIKEFKVELMSLNVNKITGGNPARNMQIKVTRKNIARLFTRLSQLTKADREAGKGPYAKLKKHRYKGTRKIRQALTPYKKSRTSRRMRRRQAWKNLKYPVLDIQEK